MRNRHSAGNSARSTTPTGGRCQAGARGYGRHAPRERRAEQPRLAGLGGSGWPNVASAEGAQQVTAQLRRELRIANLARERDRRLELVEVDLAVLADGEVRLEPRTVARAQGAVQIARQHLDELLAAHVMWIDHVQRLTRNVSVTLRALRRDLDRLSRG